MNFVLGIVFAAASYWLWPAGIFDIKIANLTLGLLFSGFFSVMFAVWSLVSVAKAFD